MSDERVTDETTAPRPPQVRIGPLPTRPIDLGGPRHPEWARFACRFACFCALCTAVVLGMAAVEAGHVVPRRLRASVGVAVVLLAWAALLGLHLLFRTRTGPPNDPRSQSERDED